MLNVVEEVAQFVIIPPNETTATIQLERFAVTVMEVALSDPFAGQDFSVDLGVRFNSEEEDDLVLNPGDIGFEMDETATASLNIPSNFFNNSSISEEISSTANNMSETFFTRIINSVFLTGALFPRINITDSNVTTSPVGSIILSSTLTLVSVRETRVVRVMDIDPPITLTFMKRQVLANQSNATTCSFWDFDQNGEPVILSEGLDATHFRIYSYYVFPLYSINSRLLSPAWYLSPPSHLCPTLPPSRLPSLTIPTLHLSIPCAPISFLLIAIHIILCVIMLVLCRGFW